MFLAFLGDRKTIIFDEMWLCIIAAELAISFFNDLTLANCINKKFSHKHVFRMKVYNSYIIN